MRRGYEYALPATMMPHQNSHRQTELPNGEQDPRENGRNPVDVTTSSPRQPEPLSKATKVSMMLGQPSQMTNVHSQTDGQETGANDPEPKTLLGSRSTSRRAGSCTAVDLGHVGRNRLQEDHAGEMKRQPADQSAHLMDSRRYVRKRAQNQRDRR